jgi:hypothetical protein
MEKQEHHLGHLVATYFQINNERRRKTKARKRAVEFRANQERERQINQRIGMKRIADEEREKTPN